MRSLSRGAVMGRRLAVAAAAVVLAAGCANHEKDVRARTQELVSHLARNETDGCVDLMDPQQVAKETRAGAKLRFDILNGFMKLGKIGEQDIRIDGVTVDKDKTTASAAYSLRVNGEWKGQAPLRWVRRDKTWYYSP